MDMKKIARRILPRPVRAFLSRHKYDLLYLFYLARRTVHRIRYAEVEQSLHQRILAYHSNVDFTSTHNLLDSCEKLGFEFRQGGHAIYLYRDSDIRMINPEIAKLYPHPFGLKIIKSSDISPDGTPYYTSRKISSASNLITMRAVGSVREKMIVSNIISLRNVAPRVYDIIKLRSGDLNVFAMVVQHVEGQIVTGQAATEFVKQFKRVLNEEGIVTISPRQHVDLLPPDFSGNVVSDSTGTYYVDIQNFAIFNRETHNKKLAAAIQEETHFGESRLFRPKKYAYQSVPVWSIPGKRDSLYRILKIKDFLERNHVSFQGSTVLDVGCNIGIFIMQSLSLGARWCVGLDKHNIAKIGRHFLFEHGFSRFDMIGCDLRESSVANLLPFKKYDLLLYLSIENHIGFPDWLNELDIRFFLYEGHASESTKNIKDKIMQWAPQAEIIGQQVLQDGDSRPRPMLLCHIQKS